MVACSINIAEEFYSLLTIDPYETDVQTIDADTRHTTQSRGTEESQKTARQSLQT